MANVLQHYASKNKKIVTATNNTHRAPVNNESQANPIPQSTLPKKVLKVTEEKDTYSATSLNSGNPITLEYLNIPIDQIDFDKDSSRCNVDNNSIKQLAKSINENGLLQAIIVKRESGRYKVVTGNRRLAACITIGFKTIHAKVEPTESITHAFPIIENIKRSDYEPISFAIEIRKRITSLKPELDLDAMIKIFNNTDRQSKRKNKIDATVTSILEETERSASTIRNHLNLLKLPAQLQQAIAENKLKPTLGYVLANNTGHPDFDANCQKALKENMSKSTLENLFKSSVAPQAGTDQNSATAQQVLKKMIDIERELRERSDDLSYDDANKLLSEVMLIKEIIEELRPKDGLDTSKLADSLEKTNTEHH